MDIFGKWGHFLEQNLGSYFALLSPVLSVLLNSSSFYFFFSLLKSYLCLSAKGLQLTTIFVVESFIDSTTSGINASKQIIYYFDNEWQNYSMLLN